MKIHWPQTLILLVGPPGSGKSTIAEKLKERFGITHRDIDEVRARDFGVPTPNDGTSVDRMAQDAREMGGAYTMLFGVMAGFLQAWRPLIVTCTLSHRVHGQQRLVTDVTSKFPDAKIRIIWCWPEITREELAQRFADRSSSGYVGGTTNPDRAWMLRQQFHPIELPHLKLYTGPAKSVESCVDAACAYITAS